MQLTKLEALILGEAADDYETIAWLTEPQEKRMGRPVSEEEVEGAVGRLAALGLIQMYIVNHESRTYVPCAYRRGKAGEQVFFKITEKGLVAEEENFDESWRSEADDER